MEGYNHYTDILIRMLVYSIALVASFGLFCMVPSTQIKGLKFLEKWGKNSLWVYMFHRPITLIFAKIYPGPNNLYVPVCIIAALIVTIIFSSEKLNTFLNKYLDKIVNYLNNIRLNKKAI